MRYLKHMALWIVWGLFVTGLFSALLSGLTLGVFSYLTWDSNDWFAGPRIGDAFHSSRFGATLGGIEGGVGGAIAFLGLALPRPPVKREFQRLWLVTKTIGLCLLIGIPLLGGTLLTVNKAAIDSTPESVWKNPVTDSPFWLLFIVTAPTIVPVIAGAFFVLHPLKRLKMKRPESTGPL